MKTNLSVKFVLFKILFLYLTAGICPITLLLTLVTRLFASKDVGLNTSEKQKVARAGLGTWGPSHRDQPGPPFLGPWG